jgi:hypothetical protein
VVENFLEEVLTVLVITVLLNALNSFRASTTLGIFQQSLKCVYPVRICYFIYTSSQ